MSEQYPCPVDPTREELKADAKMHACIQGGVAFLGMLIIVPAIVLASYVTSIPMELVGFGVVAASAALGAIHLLDTVA